jgi:hypothetical protein
MSTYSCSMSQRRYAFLGCALWAGGTFALRSAPAGWLPTTAFGWSLTYVGSFVIALVSMRVGLSGRRVPSDAPAALVAGWLILPTLLLDPWSALLFPRVFPHLPTCVAGAFGGWMLVSCAGVLAGALL